MSLKTESQSANGSNEAPTPEKKSKTSVKYPPYVNAYGTIPQLFSEITKASVPPKFNQDFMAAVLGLKSSSHRALIPLLKKLEFIDAANVPTEHYKEYRGPNGKSVMAQQIKHAYSDVFKANEYAFKLSKDQITSKLKVLTGAADDDEILKAVVSTMLELFKLANFDDQIKPKKAADKLEQVVEEQVDNPALRKINKNSHFGLSYTINLNLPATTEIEVFNAIFKSLKEHILDGQ